MSDDLELAALLGEAPPRAPDPGFRYDVFVRVTAAAIRRAAFRKALRTIALFALLGLAFPVMRALGLTLEALQPLLLVAGVLGLAYLLALLTIDGPRGALARSRQMLRARGRG